MKIAILTKEFPPYIYGGAGVHVDYLTRALAGLDRGEHDVHVLCFGDQKGMTQGRRVTGITA
ncbi:MAG: glycogen synthase, partial [Desulfobacterales bacterium]|nr:glycogen synthase [Desulfobacterales bacterium]